MGMAKHSVAVSNPRSWLADFWIIYLATSKYLNWITQLPRNVVTHFYFHVESGMLSKSAIFVANLFNFFLIRIGLFILLVFQVRSTRSLIYFLIFETVYLFYLYFPKSGALVCLNSHRHMTKFAKKK